MHAEAEEHYRMRLRGPWQYRWLRREGSEPQDAGPAAGGEHPWEGRVKLPADWRELFGETAGAVRFRRVFHRPTNLDDYERVYVVFDGVGGEATVRLNDRELGRIGPQADTAEFHITELLRPSNELMVDTAFDPGASEAAPGGLWKTVALEVRAE